MSYPLTNRLTNKTQTKDQLLRPTVISDKPLTRKKTNPGDCTGCIQIVQLDWTSFYGRSICSNVQSIACISHTETY